MTIEELCGDCYKVEKTLRVYNKEQLKNGVIGFAIIKDKNSRDKYLAWQFKNGHYTDKVLI